jgi:hydrogenase expression/formation protein HypD
MDLSALQNRENIERAARLLRRIAPREELRFLHVCGTHENTVTRFGMRSLLPDTIKVVSGPGCPVCVTSTSAIDGAIEIARNHALVFTFGDMFAVPGSGESLRDARAAGARVKIVYSVGDAARIARESSEPCAFFSIGFETTAPTTASVIDSGVPDNLSFITSHRLITPAMMTLLGSGRINIDGLICPGHVSTIIGTRPYQPIVDEFGIPSVICGFEPLDIMISIIELVKQHRSGKARVHNEYTRSVRTEGNPRAMELMEKVFQPCDSDWRGIGMLPGSGLRLREEFQDLEANRRFGLRERPGKGMPAGCRCAEVLLGSCAPQDCPHFASSCTPDSPVGPCMVSSEGTCRIWFLYGGTQKDLEAMD